MAQVIRRTSVNPWGQAAGIIGQGLSGFGSGYLMGKQLKMTDEHNKRMEELFGRGGERINATPATQNPVVSEDDFNDLIYGASPQGTDLAAATRDFMRRHYGASL